MILFTHKVSKREKKPNGRVLNVIGYLKLIYENPNLGLQQFSGTLVLLELTQSD